MRDEICELTENQRRHQRQYDEIMEGRRLRASLEADAYLRGLGPLRRHSRWLVNHLTILVCGLWFALAVAWCLGGFRG